MGAPAKGEVGKLVGRACRSLVQSSPTEVLIEVYDEWRRDHRDRTLQTDLLAPLLARYNISIYRLDLGNNECPPSVLPLIPAGYSGYYFVHANARERKLLPQKMKKLDPSFEKVLKFVAKHSTSKTSVLDVLVEHDGV